MRIWSKTGSLRAIAPALALAVSLLLGAAFAAQTDTEKDNGAVAVSPANLRTAVFTDAREYRPGRPVTIETQLTNFGRRVTFVNLQEYDIVVREARSGAVVWQWSWQFHRRNVLPPHTTFSLARWETRFNRVQWNQTGNNGRPVPPGVYRIEARIYPHTQVTQIAVQDAQAGRRP